MCNIIRVRKWLDDYKIMINIFISIVSLVTTIILAAITYFSLLEVKEQRESSLKRYFIDTRPILQIDKPDINRMFHKKDKFYYRFSLSNHFGGYAVHDVEARLVVIVVNFYKDEIKDIKHRVLLRKGKKKLELYESWGPLAYSDDQQLTKTIKEIVDDKREASNSKLYMYLQADYTIPKEITMENKPIHSSVNSFAVYNDITRNFEYDILPKHEDALIKYMDENSLREKMIPKTLTQEVEQKNQP